MAQVTATAIRFEHPATGKVMYYVQLKDVNEVTYAISVGEKTYNICKEMEQMEKRETKDKPSITAKDETLLEVLPKVGKTQTEPLTTKPKT